MLRGARQERRLPDLVELVDGPGARYRLREHILAMHLAEPLRRQADEGRALSTSTQPFFY